MVSTGKVSSIAAASAKRKAHETIRDLSSSAFDVGWIVGAGCCSSRGSSGAYRHSTARPFPCRPPQYPQPPALSVPLRLSPPSQSPQTSQRLKRRAARDANDASPTALAFLGLGLLASLLPPRRAARNGDAQLAQTVACLESFWGLREALDQVAQFRDAIVFLPKFDQRQSLLQLG